MENFDLKKYLAEGRLFKENLTDKAEVFTDAELDMASEMLMDMYDKLGLEDSVEKSDALVKYINGWFENLDFVNEAATEVFTDAELDIASEMLMNMFDKLGLENNVEKSDALAKYINSWFENLDFVNEKAAYEAKNDIKEGVDIEKMKIEIDDVASYLEDVNKEKEVMSNVLDRHDSDPFETMGEVYAYLDGLLQKY